jgi:hypothetical protein
MNFELIHITSASLFRLADCHIRNGKEPKYEDTEKMDKNNVICSCAMFRAEWKAGICGRHNFGKCEGYLRTDGSQKNAYHDK